MSVTTGELPALPYSTQNTPQRMTQMSTVLTQRNLLYLNKMCSWCPLQQGCLDKQVPVYPTLRPC